VDSDFGSFTIAVATFSMDRHRNPNSTKINQLSLCTWVINEIGNRIQF